MGIAIILLFVLTWVVSTANAFGCIKVQQDQMMNGWACEPFGHYEVTIYHIPYKHCSLTCFQSQKCQAFLYDRLAQACMILDGVCVWPRPNVGHIYGISKPQCFKWEPHDTDHQFYWFMESGSLKCYAGRQRHQGNMLVGKATTMFFTIDPSSSLVIRGGSYEKLVVETSCQVIWVPHDANSDQPLPSDALIGGVLSDTNTPLYVVRQQASGKLFTSYYNPLINLAWGELWSSVRSTAVFEVMTIKRL